MKIYSESYYHNIKKFSKDHDVDAFLLGISNLLGDFGQRLLDWASTEDKQVLLEKVEFAISSSYDEYEFFYNLITKYDTDIDNDFSFTNASVNTGDACSLPDSGASGKHIASVFNKIQSSLPKQAVNATCTKDIEEIESEIKNILCHYIPSSCTNIQDVVYKVLQEIIICKTRQKGNLILIEGGEEKYFIIKHIQKALVYTGIKYHTFDRENLPISEDIEVCFLEYDNIEYLKDFDIFKRRKTELRDQYKVRTVFIVPISNGVQNKIRNPFLEGIFDGNERIITIPELNDEELLIAFSGFTIYNYSFNSNAVQHIINALALRGITRYRYKIIKNILEYYTYPLIMLDHCSKSSIGHVNVSIEESLIDRLVDTVTGIAKPKIFNSDEVKLKLRQHVIGQDAVIDRIAPYIVSMQHKRVRPNFGVYFFFGPSGTGKSHLAKIIAQEFFNGRYHKEDMNTYTESHTALRLIGAPPSYIGYGDSTAFLSFIKYSQKGVILLDEIEKAHPTVIKQFMEWFDVGKVIDSAGNEYDLKNFLFICTSNVKLYDYSNKQIGFCGNTQAALYLNEPIIREKLAIHFPPEFVGRLTFIAHFTPLSLKDIRTIAYKLIKELLESLNCDISAVNIDALANEALNYYIPSEGVRPVKSYIDNVIRSQVLQSLG